jgi:hypothetical protein
MPLLPYCCCMHVLFHKPRIAQVATSVDNFQAISTMPDASSSSPQCDGTYHADVVCLLPKALHDSAGCALLPPSAYDRPLHGQPIHPVRHSPDSQESKPQHKVTDNTLGHDPVRPEAALMQHSAEVTCATALCLCLHPSQCRGKKQSMHLVGCG